MNVVITEWATDSYFELVVGNKISKLDYKTLIRPDVELLKKEAGLPLQNSKFQNGKFWGPAETKGKVIPSGYKMKWHNFGNGKIQLRLCIGIVNNECFLGKAYGKDNRTEKRAMANFKIHMRKIFAGNYIHKGVI